LSRFRDVEVEASRKWREFGTNWEGPLEVNFRISYRA
jgi:hypothetical protein